MTIVLHFTGFIKGVKYRACLTESLAKGAFADFDINQSSAYGIIQTDSSELAYSKWVSPKRTRSYPFARIYNTYNAAKILTVIPVIKDEGRDGDLDKLQYSTISWMNLLNTYIVLGYYENAEKSYKDKQSTKNKLTKQRFNNEFIKSQIQEILDYKQSALHWNRSLFEERFVEIFRKALDSYAVISRQINVPLHSHAGMEKYLQAIIKDFEEFKNISLKGSRGASRREAATSHKLEYLIDGMKATFCIENYLGGTYYLTPDEMIHVDESYIIQESKNSTRKALPELSDIQDGLFKLIVYSNIDALQLNGHRVNFSVRLRLTGRGIKDSIILPWSPEKLEEFIRVNSLVFSKKEESTIRKLLLEVEHNENVEIEIRANR
ncbi:MAG: hypothetical protein KME42_17490 [Tildeniella nuda ZEHNDER 1965/U140]|jgi:hypothetical protein|nr:hypothetical protein [Tildeniella nuda ZEHNDER 1965/U140]